MLDILLFYYFIFFTPPRKKQTPPFNFGRRPLSPLTDARCHVFRSTRLLVIRCDSAMKNVWGVISRGGKRSCEAGTADDPIVIVMCWDGSSQCPSQFGTTPAPITRMRDRGGGRDFHGVGIIRSWERKMEKEGCNGVGFEEFMEGCMECGVDSMVFLRIDSDRCCIRPSPRTDFRMFGKESLHNLNLPCHILSSFCDLHIPNPPLPNPPLPGFSALAALAKFIFFHPHLPPSSFSILIKLTKSTCKLPTAGNRRNKCIAWLSTLQKRTDGARSPLMGGGGRTRKACAR